MTIQEKYNSLTENKKKSDISLEGYKVRLISNDVNQ